MLNTRQAFLQVHSDLRNKLQKLSPPIIRIKADSVAFRAFDPMKSHVLIDRNDRLQRGPITKNQILSIYDKTLSEDHRWGGLDPITGTTGKLGSSSWGTSHGVSAETMFYRQLSQSWRDPRQLIDYFQNNKFSSLFVRDAREKLQIVGGAYLPYLANSNVDILVGQIKVDLDAINFRIDSNDFEKWNASTSKYCKEELELMHYASFSELLMDGNAKYAARFVNQVIGADSNGDLNRQLPVFSTSARAGDLQAAKIDGSKALNLTLLGEANQSLSNVIDLAGLIEVRTEDGRQQAVVGSVDEAYGGKSPILLDAYERLPDR